VTAHLRPAEPEEPDLFSVKRPSSDQAGLFGVTLVVAGDIAGWIPHGTGAAATLAFGAVAGLAKACVRWRR
jgi:hypothetical protein